eukprot:CAMPEP_0197822962 /NCGR_PEP_ID=MMETSP1437-20131217/280_1 /TAXON_ID=49252 ORGANISM="Eucampia antarctica, Strain CCMP1452" /NCGR_SAMPLE_ID=MMETSP1437 /ASSEMBLY_ACC=CAM_ASM_001096 /LENGTH=239 /DNA_ID=CAMNT_0043421875 /DNA_START=72 /DNA_END=791 /DNA_ORIENTATION=+
MKSQVIATLLFASSANAFVSPKKKAVGTAVFSDGLNGWVPDESQFAWGLPGSLDPVPAFDPLGFAEDVDLNRIKTLREAELQHCRVAMLAALGMLVTEEPIEYHPLFEAYNRDIGPAIRHLDEVRAISPAFFEIFAVIIASLELNRALVGWVAPGENQSFQDLKDDYYPGDVGFDPLNLKPTDGAEFAEIQTKELQNGRLAMLGIAGMVAQELVNGEEIFVNLGLAQDRFDPSTLPVQF